MQTVDGISTEVCQSGAKEAFEHIQVTSERSASEIRLLKSEEQIYLSMSLKSYFFKTHKKSCVIFQRKGPKDGHTSSEVRVSALG